MDQRNDNDHNGSEKPASETVKEGISLVKSILEVIATLAIILTSFKGWSKNSPMFTGLLLASGLSLLLLIAYPIVSRRVRTHKRRLFIEQDQAAFIQQWQAKFDELQLLDKLNQFASSEGELSIISIVNSSASYDGPFASFVFDPAYLGKWLPCFTKRVRVPASDIRSFMARCEEFIVIVDGFYQDYALMGKEKLENLLNIEGRQALSTKGRERFETFQSKFNFYLQQVEDWSVGLEKGRNKVAGNDQFSETKLQTLSYHQVASLRQNFAEQVPLKPARADSD
jgi:hypothetical protein